MPIIDILFLLYSIAVKGLFRIQILRILEEFWYNKSAAITSFAGFTSLEVSFTGFFLILLVISIIFLAFLTTSYRIKLSSWLISSIIYCQVVLPAVIVEYAKSNYTGNVWILSLGIVIQFMSLLSLFICYWLLLKANIKLMDAYLSVSQTRGALNNLLNLICEEIKEL